MIVRHLFAVLVLPVTAVILIPLWVARTNDVALALPTTVPGWGAWRNPMISGVVLLLISEALLLRSAPHLSWAGLFFLINAVYIPLLEEPGLRVRFGQDYDDYASNVPRLVPRLRPWNDYE